MQGTSLAFLMPGVLCLVIDFAQKYDPPPFKLMLPNTHILYVPRYTPSLYIVPHPGLYPNLAMDQIKWSMDRLVMSQYASHSQQTIFTAAAKFVLMLFISPHRLYMYIYLGAYLLIKLTLVLSTWSTSGGLLWQNKNEWCYARVRVEKRGVLYCGTYLYWTYMSVPRPPPPPPPGYNWV